MVFCPKCGNQYQGNPRFCENCGLTLGQRQSGGPIWPRVMNWFQNHLNWTLVIALVVINAVTFGLFLVTFLFREVGGADIAAALCILGNIVLALVAAAWGLRQ